MAGPPGRYSQGQRARRSIHSLRRAINRADVIGQNVNLIVPFIIGTPPSATLVASLPAVNLPKALPGD